MAVDAGRAVGRATIRPDLREKVTGQALYVSDIVMPGMLEARLKRSTIPKGRIRSIRIDGALATPGVRDVLTGDMLRRIEGFDPYYGPAYKDQPALAIEAVRYEGEPVAVVVADTSAAADEALDQIEVEYDEQPGVFTLDEALAPGAPLVHEQMRSAGHFKDLAGLNPVPGTNICHHFHLQQGRGAAGLAAADRVFEHSFTFPMVEHVSMESHGVVAAPDEDGLLVYSATQHPFPVRKELSEMLRMPLNRIRVVVPYIGGAFGNKCYTKLEPLVAILALRLGRPVRLVLSMAEAFRTGRRSAVRAHVRTGVSGDGAIVAQQWRIEYQLGAYADVGPRIAQKSAYTAGGPYRIPDLEVDAYAVYTNTVPAIAFRGYGVPQLTWAYESQMDIIARQLGIDPVAFRLRHLLRHEEPLREGDRPVDADLADDLRRTAAAVGWRATSGSGQGVACTIKAPLSPSVSQAVVRLHADGSLTVLCGTVEIGQGARGVMAQIVAEELGVNSDQVEVLEPDTSVAPYDQGTSSSRSTTMMGRAVMEAARDLKRQLLDVAARLLVTPAGSPERLRLEDGQVWAPGGQHWGLGEVVAKFFGMPGGELIGHGSVASPMGRTALGGGIVPFWEVGMGAAEVEVDTETGVVRLKKYVSLADVGRAINPLQCEAQDEGAVMMGVGHTFFEQLIYDAGGQLLNSSLLDYRVPTAEDLPGQLTTVLVENADGSGPYGAKGMGESGLIPIAAAVANALEAAAGVRITELPLHPERVWRALRGERHGDVVAAPVAAHHTRG